MPVPAHRRSRSRVRSRRAHDAMKPVNPSVCSSCHATIMPHRVCADCGFYNGRKVLDNSRKAARLLRKGSSATLKHDHDHKDESSDRSK